MVIATIIKLKKGELATSERLQLIDCDDVIITKITDNQYKIDKAEFGSYENFINNL
ncbi:restriction endonuclease [Moraxella catarrhalis BC8]|nr:restriction endonuclease [Moraxella catarrhalis BC8]